MGALKRVLIAGGGTAPSAGPGGGQGVVITLLPVCFASSSATCRARARAMGSSGWPRVKVSGRAGVNPASLSRSSA